MGVSVLFGSCCYVFRKLLWLLWVCKFKLMFCYVVLIKLMVVIVNYIVGFLIVMVDICGGFVEGLC